MNIKLEKHPNIINIASYTLICLFLCRLFAMYYIPLNDSTEARYGEIARIMLETGNWITLTQNYIEPFWAKPPLSTWLSAIAMSIFGVNAFAERVPALLLSIGILWIVWGIVRKRTGIEAAIYTVIILSGSILFYLDAGVVMTDPALLLSTTLTIISFWRAVAEREAIFGYWFFIAIGLGLLAKGPIAIVLTGMPIFLWVLKYNKWRELWQNLPWIKGIMLSITIALPWYILAELKTPGFLNYFIIGEHINRFFVPGWTGDKYGFAHTAPIGMIWIYALIAIFPWSIPASVFLCKNRKNLVTMFTDKDNWLSYLLMCTITPLIFFTFAHNIIYPYVLPILPTFAILFGELTYKYQLSPNQKRKVILLALLSALIFVIVTILFIIKPEFVEKSQYRIVKYFNTHKLSTNSKLIYWSKKLDFSAQFYSRGKATFTDDETQLNNLLNSNQEIFVCVEQRLLGSLPKNISEKMHLQETINVLSSKYLIFVPAS